MEPSNVVKPEPYTDTCPTHGEYTSEQIPMFDGCRPFRKGCPKCLEIRRIEREAEDARAEEFKRAQAELKAMERLRKSGVPARFEEKTLDSYLADNTGQQKAVAACQRLVQRITDKQQAPNLILMGKPGTGKTHLSCGIILALFKSFRVCRIDLPDLIREIRATWRKDSDLEEEDILRWYGGLDLLILEEVGTGSGSEDEKARIFQVINRRYEAMLPTVVVSNLTYDELLEEMGERVIDRLREGERSLVVFDWESMRGKT